MKLVNYFEQFFIFWGILQKLNEKSLPILKVIISCGETLTEEKWDCVMLPMTNSFGWVDVDPEKSYIDAAKVSFVHRGWKYAVPVFRRNFKF